MPVVQVMPRKKLYRCSMTAEGKLTIPAPVLDALGWEHGTLVSLNYLSSPLTLLFRKVNDESGFKLMRRVTAAASSPAGLLSCTSFARTTLRARIALPQKNLSPIILKRNDYRLAVMLEPVVWTQEEFSQSGRQKIPADVKGVYQLLGSNGDVLRIGEGAINARVAQHLKNDAYTPVVSRVRYFALADKEETELLEHVMLADYVAENYRLPALNTIRG